MNNIKIKIAQNPDYVISSEEESELIEIAEQCIRIGGNSVQKATFLLPPCLNINRNSCDDYDEPAPLIYSNNENLEPIEYETNFKKNNIDVNIYPNPANKFVNIEVEGLASMELFNSSSILLKKYEFYNTNSFDLSELPEGVYYCQIRLESGDSVLKKLVIVK